MATSGLTVERVLFNGIEMTLSDAVGQLDAGEEENTRISEMIDFLDANDDPQFLLSTVSSKQATSA